MAAVTAVALQDLKSELSSQHQQIRAMLRSVATSSGAPRAEAFDQLRTFLAVHEAAEQEHLHPIPRADGGQDVPLIDERVSEEDDAAAGMTRLEALDIGSDAFSTAFAPWADAVTAHTEAEEHQEIPALQGLVDEDAVTAATAQLRRVPHLADSTRTAEPFADQLKRARREFREDD
ncbi:hemerythrin domain-containing protein [Luteipulveratus flavus]|uniref:Hemerythrin domain-containing protein n=1 Tax=Luteipulveratus flavus TaxID=3031728 RepID=A0ABT6C7M9_9MICO|nr:hemerythrin domain-containing protein [Luteipulveratus sp. YIM 133296]MDF8264870.1 hemerythrin domain-containing protein [Luteipulveratus sp. YIM 133296]